MLTLPLVVRGSSLCSRSSPVTSGRILRASPSRCRLVLGCRVSHCRPCPSGGASGPRERCRSQFRPFFTVRVATLGPLRASNVSPTLPSSQPSTGAASAKNSHISSRLESNAHMISSCPFTVSRPLCQADLVATIGGGNSDLHRPGTGSERGRHTGYGQRQRQPDLAPETESGGPILSRRAQV